MATIGLQHGLDPGPEGLAGLDNEVHGHLGPLLLNGGLQGIHTGMGDATGLSLHDAPDAIVKWIAIRA